MRPGCAHSSSGLVVLDGLSKPGPCRVRHLLRHDGEVMLGGFGFPVLLNLSAGLDIAVVGVFPWDRRDLRQVAEYGVPLHDQERDRKSTRLNSSHYCASRMPSAA